MKQLKWWFRIVGGLYVVLGIGFFPPINEPRLPLMIPLDVPETSIAYMALVDWTFFFGLDMLIIGAFLLYASRDPLRHTNLLWLVVALEAVRGVLADVYYISRGYASVPVYVGFMILHLVVIATGIWALRTAQLQAEEPGSVTAHQ